VIKSLLSHIIEIASSGKSFSDIQIEEGMPVVWRAPAGWEATEYGVVRQSDMLQIINSISTEWKTAIQKGMTLNRTIEIGGLRFRCCMYTTHSRSRVAITLRTLPNDPPRLESLGLPIQISQFVMPSKGILLIAGATGVGKTTTIAALVDRINEQRPVHVVTIEDPIEVGYTRKKAIITQREVGSIADVSSFAQGVNEAMRQCPDVIVIGEIRDTDTAEAALRAAESGHYVIASLHAKSALGGVQKLFSFFGDDARASKAAVIANTLCGVVFQAIMPSADGHRNIVAAEILTGNEIEISVALTQPDKMRGIEERLKKGMLPGSIYLNATLKQMVAKGIVQQRVAQAASYAPEDFG
jgi:twitching motility protein PilT